MADNVIGFAGIDKYDLILYLSRILFHMGKKVLLADCSESQALYHCIPVPDSLRESSSPVDYRGVDFIRGQYFEPDILEDYDAVLIDMGSKVRDNMAAMCTVLYYVTDLQLHNINRIKNRKYIKNTDSFLVIKDVIQCKIKPEYVLEQLDSGFDRSRVYILYQDAVDLKCRIQSQYNYIFGFSKLSEPARYLLRDIVKQVSRNLGEKEISHAFRKAERGK